MKTGIAQVFDSDDSVVLTPPCKQENFVTQIFNLLVKFQAWCYSRCLPFLHPLIELGMIKNFHPTNSQSNDTGKCNCIKKNTDSHLTVHL